MENIDNLMPFKGNWNIFDAGDMDAFTRLMDQYGDAAMRAIDSILHEEGAEEIKKHIAQLLPESGRRWKRKGASAKAAMPRKFSQDNDILAVTIAARGKYHYLYFPDDGTNTERHVGNQRFMQKGAEKATPKIIELCLGKLIT